MKILHVSGAKGWRGGEQQVAYLLDELPESAHVFCPGAAPLAGFARERGLPLQTYRNRWLAGQHLARYARRVRADLIHLHDAHAHQIGVLSATFSRNHCPMVLSRRVFFRPSPNPISRWRYNHVAVRRILCVSEAVKKLHESYVRHPEQLVVVPSGIDPARFPAEPTGKLRQELGIGKAVPIVGTVGALTREKDQMTFLKVARELLQTTHLHFVLLGDGKEKGTLRAFAQQEGMTDHVHFLGFRAEVPQLLSDFNVFLFTSRQEGLGTSILDAFASGVPVVATDVGGIPEMVQDGQTGRLAPAGDVEALSQAVREILADPVSAQRLTAKAHDLLQARFTKQAMAEATQQVYQELLGDRGQYIIL